MFGFDSQRGTVFHGQNFRSISEKFVCECVSGEVTSLPTIQVQFFIPLKSLNAQHITLVQWKTYKC